MVGYIAKTKKCERFYGQIERLIIEPSPKTNINLNVFGYRHIGSGYLRSILLLRSMFKTNSR
jgi:hypothetical protein